MQKEYQQFIDDCREIVKQAGIDNAKTGLVDIVGCGIDNAPYRTYEDDSIRISANTNNKRISVTLKPPLVPITNPVLHTDKDGVPYRFHGESQLAFGYVKELLNERKNADH